MAIRRTARMLPCARWLWLKLNDDALPSDATKFEQFCYRWPDALQRGLLKAAWQQHRAAILADWKTKRPGEVPSCSEKFDANT